MKPDKHFTTRRGFIATLGFGGVSLYGLWAGARLRLTRRPDLETLVAEREQPGAERLVRCRSGACPTP